MSELWVRATTMSCKAPYVFSSRYYALKQAAEAVAENLPLRKKQKFLDYAYNKYKHESNYAGD